MNRQLLKELLAVPSVTYDVKLMREWLLGHLNKRGFKHWTDDYGNVYALSRRARAGNVYFPCVCAHMDTVHRPEPIMIQEEGDRLFAVNEAGHPVGCGGDDKAGIFICLELLEATEVQAVFFADEETGCHGSRAAPVKHFRDVGYILEFDCPCEDIMSFTNSGVRLFSTEGSFMRRVWPQLQRFGVTNWQNHPYTDVSVLAPKVGVSCLNLPSGFYRIHGPDEYVQVSMVERSVVLGCALITALGLHYYPRVINEGKEPPPPVEVWNTCLHDFDRLCVREVGR